jgi:hypothetical protein
MKIKPILLAHFKQNGLTVYRSAKKVLLEKNDQNDVDPTIGTIIFVKMPGFRVKAFIDGKIASVLLVEFSRFSDHISNPEEALKLVGLDDKAIEKINSWKRSLAWKKGGPIEKDWNFTVEAYEYSDFSWENCTVEVSIPGQHIFDVEINLEDSSIIATITFKDAEGYIQNIEQELNY